MHDEKRAQRSFLLLWTLITATKIFIAARLPLFVDEAFYWQEGQHLAAAYSDLPGLTAWLLPTTTTTVTIATNAITAAVIQIANQLVVRPAVAMFALRPRSRMPGRCPRRRVSP